MGRNIVLLSDGTGNSSAKVWRTNVWRTFEALDLSGSDQVAFYDDGVGTSSFKPWAVLGGAFGFGLRRNVLSLYKFACRNYQDDSDRLFGFGFSRGAFTIRIVMGLIANQGIIKADSESELDSLASAAYRAYRKERYENLRLERVYQFLRNKVGPIYPPKGKLRPVKAVHFIGVWDTVSAYGFPVKEMNDGLHKYLWPIELPDGKLNPKVARACQALALDEERTTFHPQLWKETGENPAPANPSAARSITSERITQVWFAGVHSNIGGGYPDDSLAYIPFVWMITEAQRNGLKFKSDYSSVPGGPPEGAVAADPDTFKNAISRRDKDGRLYDPRKGLGGYYRYGPRKLVPEFYPDAGKGEGDEVLVARAKIHESVFKRIANHAQAYAPVGLPPLYDVVMDDGTIVPPDQYRIPQATKPFETNEAAADRAEAQEHVWNEIWKRRAIYFLTLAATLWLVMFPLINDAQRADEFKSGLRWISDLVRIVGNFLPGFASTWIDGYARAPGQFAVSAIAVVVLLAIGGVIQGRTSDLMMSLWHHRASAPVGKPTDAIFNIRDSKKYKTFLTWLKSGFAPVLFAFLFVYLAVAIVNRALYNVQDIAGLTCLGNEKPEGLANGETFRRKITFSTKDLCLATGLSVEANGAKYRVLIEPGADWKDWWIEIPPGGFSSVSPPRWYYRLIMAPGVLFRRNLTQDWFRVALRYGSVGGEEDFYVPDVTDRIIRFNIKPKRDGELFIYVNDATLMVPGFYDFFYWNNKGTATLSISRE